MNLTSLHVLNDYLQASIRAQDLGHIRSALLSMTVELDRIEKRTSEDAFSRLMWWGYLHSNGVIIVKRWFGDHKDYTTDCEGNDFIVKVVKPFAAMNQAVALAHITKEVNET